MDGTAADGLRKPVGDSGGNVFVLRVFVEG